MATRLWKHRALRPPATRGDPPGAPAKPRARGTVVEVPPRVFARW